MRATASEAAIQVGLASLAVMHSRFGKSRNANATPAGAPPKMYRRKSPRVNRNDPCPCGSGKKFKRCCL